MHDLSKETQAVIQHARGLQRPILTPEYRAIRELAARHEEMEDDRRENPSEVARLRDALAKRPRAQTLARMEMAYRVMEQVYIENCKERQRAVDMLRDVREHLEEMRGAWERGVISENDGYGGRRANRNAELEVKVRQLLDAELKAR